MSHITKRSVTEHAAALRRGEYSSLELTREYIKAIKERDGNIGAFLLLDEENAVKAAVSADERLRRGDAPLLCGIPCAVKDNIMTEGVPTTCGSKILEGYIPPYDATVIKKLKEGGAVILGKTNLDEFAMGSSTENSAFQKTVNPHDASRVPGGSSGGSAAAVAAGEAAFALGSDTGGSVRQPASFCGLVGIKPTYGAVSRYGLCAMTSSLDQIGPLTRTVRDNAAVLSALCGHDEKDSTSLGIAWGDLSEDCGKDIKGLKIGVSPEMFEGITKDVEAALSEAKNTLKKMGCHIVEISMPSFAYVFADYKVICCAEVASNMGRFDGIRYGKNAVGELYFGTRGDCFGKEVKRRIMMGTYVLSAENHERYYGKALKVKNLILHEMNEALRSCDAILSPAASTVAFRFGQTPLLDGLYTGDAFCMAASLAGLPSLSVPCGTGDGSLPVGMLLTGKRCGEKLLYRMGDAFERYCHE